MFYNRLNREYPLQVRNYGNEWFRPMTNRFSMLEERYNRHNTELHTATPSTDILELDDQFILEIALPGVVLDDVELKVEENILTLVAKRTPNMFEERAALLHKELPCGYFVRHFEFETEILVEHIEARMDRGILFVSIPKVEQAIRIPVSHGNIESHLPGMKHTRVSSKNDTLRNKELTVK
jgi:HSP20 family protein